MDAKGKLAVNAAIDHVFICCSVGASAEAAALVRLGAEAANTHRPGHRVPALFEAPTSVFWVADRASAGRQSCRRGSSGSGQRHPSRPFAIIFQPGTWPARHPPFRGRHIDRPHARWRRHRIARTPLAGPGFLRGPARPALSARNSRRAADRKLVGPQWRPPAATRRRRRRSGRRAGGVPRRRRLSDRNRFGAPEPWAGRREAALATLVW